MMVGGRAEGAWAEEAAVVGVVEGEVVVVAPNPTSCSSNPALSPLS